MPALPHNPGNPQIFDDVLERALLLFQHAHGLPEDGTLNDATIAIMKIPRCGFRISMADKYNLTSHLV